MSGGRRDGKQRKYSDSKDVGAKADGEVIAPPPSYPIDVAWFGEKNNGQGGHDCPCAYARFQRTTLKNKTPFPMVEPA